MVNRIYRVRIKFSRLGPAANLSHLQQIRVLKDMVQKSGLSCVMASFGRLKTPKISFGPAISLGYESLAEYADVFLSVYEGDGKVLDRINKTAESGFLALSAKKIPVNFPSVESLVNTAEYEIRGDFTAATDIEEFLKQREIYLNMFIFFSHRLVCETEKVIRNLTLRIEHRDNLVCR